MSDDEKDPLAEARVVLAKYAPILNSEIAATRAQYAVAQDAFTHRVPRLLAALCDELALLREYHAASEAELAADMLYRDGLSAPKPVARMNHYRAAVEAGARRDAARAAMQKAETKKRGR